MSRKLLIVIFVGIIFNSPAFSQTSAPVIAGVVNSASYSSPIAPGSLVSIFGTGLSGSTEAASPGPFPLPTRLGGSSVTINGVPAPLVFVSPGQINAEVPSSVGRNAASLVSAAVVVSTAAGSSLPAMVDVLDVGPGFFTSNSSGCGPAAALNIRPDGAVSVNSRSNSAAPGDYLALFGTGLGVPTVDPADGQGPLGADPFRATGVIHLDYSDQTTVPAYSGLAPTLTGVDQVNVKIPSDAREGCAVPIWITAENTMLSPVATVSIGRNRGTCVDPASESYGEVWLEKTIASGTANDGETDRFTAMFPAAPGLPMPPVDVMPPGTNVYNFAIPASSRRVFAIPGYTQLSAGNISVQGPANASPAIAAPLAQTNARLLYNQNLPSGFVQPGRYTVYSQRDAPTAVVFEQSLAVGPEISVQTPLAPGTILDASSTKTIRWSGGDATSLIRVRLIADTRQVASPMNVWYASGDAGWITLSVCTGGASGPTICGYGLPHSDNAEMIVDVLPANGVAVIAANVLGISQKVRFSWAYHYVFAGLSLR